MGNLFMEVLMLKIIEKAEIYSVTLEEVKTHLRLEQSEDDQYLLHLIETATDYIENYINRSLICQKLEFTSPPTRRADGLYEVRLPRPNIIKIHSVHAIKGDIARYTIKRYQLLDKDTAPKLIFGQADSIVEVVYESGFGVYPKHVPASIRHALLQIVADLYENRGNELLTKSEFYKNLLQPFCMKRL